MDIRNYMVDSSLYFAQDIFSAILLLAPKPPKKRPNHEIIYIYIYIYILSYGVMFFGEPAIVDLHKLSSDGGDSLEGEPDRTSDGNLKI